jgi:hypothetical protein
VTIPRNSGNVRGLGVGSKKFVQQGHSHFCARNVLAIREHGKMARTPLAAFFNRPIQNIGLLARSCESMKGSSPMVRRLPSGPRVCTNNYREGLGSGAGESGWELDGRLERRISSSVSRASRPELVSKPFDRLVSA